MANDSDDRVASESLKMAAAEDVGIADKVRSEGWGDVTTRQVGLVVRNMIRRGEEALAKEATDPQDPGQIP